MAQADVPLHPRAPQVQVAVAKAKILRYRRVFGDLEGRPAGFVQDSDVACRHLDLTGLNPRVQRVVRPSLDDAGDGHDELGSQTIRGGQQPVVLADDRLGDAVPIADIDEDERPKIANLVHPSEQLHVLPDVTRAKLAARMGPGQFLVLDICRHEVTSCELRVTGYELRAAGYQ
jgi:hypothetical protein